MYLDRPEMLQNSFFTREKKQVFEILARLFFGISRSYIKQCIILILYKEFNSHHKNNVGKCSRRWIINASDRDESQDVSGSKYPKQGHFPTVLSFCIPVLFDAKYIQSLPLGWFLHSHRINVKYVQLESTTHHAIHQKITRSMVMTYKIIGRSIYNLPLSNLCLTYENKCC
jgi:hypothetical protein